MPLQLLEPQSMSTCYV